jgi:hypothetical protein
MGMKLTAKDLGELIEQVWPQPKDDWYMDDCNDELYVRTFPDYDFKNPAHPLEEVTLEDFDAFLGYQGKEGITESYSLVKLIKKALKKRDFVRILVDVPATKEMLDAVTAAIKAAGGKIVK